MYTQWRHAYAFTIGSPKLLVECTKSQIILSSAPSSVICRAPQALNEKHCSHIYIIPAFYRSRIFVSWDIAANLIGIMYIYEQCFSLSACGARQMTEEWAELNIIWLLVHFTSSFGTEKRSRRYIMSINHIKLY